MTNPLWAQKNLNPREIGNLKSKVVFTEYASFTCPHCAKFSTEIFPQLKKDFIDTNKIKFVYDDFPLDGLAFAVSALARCIDDNKAYFAMVEHLFKTQEKWAGAQDPKATLFQIFALAGVSGEMAEKCLNNKELLAKLQASRENASKNGVASTPTLMINNKIIKYNDYADLKQQINSALSAK